MVSELLGRQRRVMGIVHNQSKVGIICEEHRIAANVEQADGSLWCLQSITGSYTLQPKLQAIVDGFVNISNDAVANITAAEALASYDSIHPFYLEVSLARIVSHEKKSE